MTKLFSYFSRLCRNPACVSIFILSIGYHMSIHRAVSENRLSKTVPENRLSEIYTNNTQSWFQKFLRNHKSFLEM